MKTRLDRLEEKFIAEVMAYEGCDRVKAQGIVIECLQRDDGYLMIALRNWRAKCVKTVGTNR